MSPHLPPTIVLFSVPGTLEGIDPLLRRARVRLIRIASIEPRPVDPAIWQKRLGSFTNPDTVVVTSRTAVAAGVRPWRRAARPRPATLEFWAAGPGTAEALRRVGIRQVHRPPTTGALAVAKALRRTVPRKVLYFRSDLAGPRLAQALRADGHRVLDVVVYRSEASPRLTARARRHLSAADLLIVTSPSGLSILRRQLGPRAFSRASRTARLVVLGERSRRAAGGHGFRQVSVAPSTTAQRFTRHLLRELLDART
jgi:uroporphyrinogen-III synthase